ncbi:VRR-NUC domain-containing protein [Mycena belliarum]|uniref:Fanconi-associated nuclease n=1 Tax=Mycena belliarum TaxID=1033014 RepID=A0AAD6UFL9_9AGAR|nr:VRR-NUC domain-containing protein [Mycena belliae]
MNRGAGRTILDLIFGRGEDSPDEHDIDEAEKSRETEPDTSVDGCKTWKRPSLYVHVVECAINKIGESEGERRLFTDEEWDFLNVIAKLDYHSRFILIRLIMRKPGWHRLANLQSYASEVGPDGVLPACQQLCQALRPVVMDVDEEDDGIIDLTLDSDDEDDSSSPQPIAGPSSLRFQSPPDVCLTYLCQDEKDLSTLDGLRALNLAEIKTLCKTMKISHTKLKKDELITALINGASTQSILTFTPNPKSKGNWKGKSRASGLRQTTLPFAAKDICAQTNRLRHLMLCATGKCIRVNPYIRSLFLRLHIIWFRSTELPDSLFLHALLAGFNKRTFATYVHVRDPAIWGTREKYLEYETALQIEATVDEILKPEPKSARAVHTPAPEVGARFITPGTPGLDFLRSLTTPARTPGAQSDAEDDGEATLDFDVVEDTVAEQKAKMVKRILDEHVLAKWKELASAASENGAVRKPGLERFESGFVYTRIVRKCGQALATLKEFSYEKDLLDMLLAQRFWRRGRRAAWYDRRALLQMNYLCKNGDGTKNMDVLRQARDGIIEALGDDHTATVLRPSLIRRLDRVEKILKLSAADKAKHSGLVLQKPDEVSFSAVRIWDHPDGSGKVKGKENNGPSIAAYLVTPVSIETPAAAERINTSEPKKKSASWSWKGKSIWEGKEGPVNVETRALEYYAELGFKGFHSETQILTTLFALLFWDIIFAPVQAAFETPWQFGPLDIGEDAFYYARQELIEKRLHEIDDGQARAILEVHDDLHRERKTCCIGVRWQVCGRDELVEIVECLGGHALSSICRLFCEDYEGRSSGVPDLIVWNPATKECKFVEVKGPGDSLSENQKLWSDALLTARCAVEVCHVVDPKAKKKKVKSVVKKTPKLRENFGAALASTSRVRAGADSAESESDVEGASEVPIVIGDDEAWVPSTASRKPLPPRSPKRRRRSAANDDLPHFALSESPEPSAISPASKKRRTV